MQSRGVRRPSVCPSVRPSVNISQLTAGYWQNGWLVGWLIGGKSCLSYVACLSVACQSVRARFAHISGTGRPIDFLFDPMVRFSGTADRMDLLPVSPNLTWRLLMTSSRNNRCRNFGAKYIGNEAR